jgi:hypothetical protein
MRYQFMTVLLGLSVLSTASPAATQGATADARRAEYQERYKALSPTEKRRVDNINRQIRELQEQRHRTLYPPQRSEIRR